jgi:multidrug transporter EmrE-like cation transporter
MPSALDLPLFILYSLAGTVAAAFGKAAIQRALAGFWTEAAVRAVGTLASFAINFGLLFVLLARIDMSVMVPVAVGFNLLCASVLSIVVFRERIDAWKLAGMLLIVGGVILLSVDH